MTSDDQHFFDHLGRVSSTVQNFFSHDLGTIAKQTDKVVSGALKQTVDQINSVFGVNIPTPGPFIITPSPPEPISLTFWERSQAWVGRNRAVAAALIAFVGTGAIGAMLLYGHSMSVVKHRKRKAKKAKNGSRTEVVVLAGVPGSPIVKSLSHDLEKRGFVVYVVVTSEEEQALVTAESRQDIRPLSLDLTNPVQTESAVSRFSQQFLHPVRPFPGATPHQPHFVGLILVPETDSYPTGSIQHLPDEIWSDALNSHVLSSLIISRAFVPLAIDQNARILLITPNLVAPLRPALNGVQSVVLGALEGFIGTLQRELGASGSRVVHLKLGDVEFGSISGMSSSSSPNRNNRITRSLYGHELQAPKELGASTKKLRSRATPVRELHHAVFDALTLKSPCRVVRVGRGSLLYEMIGRWMPYSLTERMLHTDGAMSSELTGDWEKMEESVLAQ